MRFTHIRNAIWTAVIVVPLLVAGRPVAAQQGRITGTVTDKLNNTPLPGARMQLGNRYTNTNRDGHYAFAGVGAGTYTVRATGQTYDIAALLHRGESLHEDSAG